MVTIGLFFPNHLENSARMLGVPLYCKDLKSASDEQILTSVSFDCRSVLACLLTSLQVATCTT